MAVKAATEVGRVLSRGQVTLPRKVRRAAGIRPGDTVSFRVTGEGTVEIRALTRMRLSEALEKYRIEGPVDDAADRNVWQRVAAADVLSRQHE